MYLLPYVNFTSKEKRTLDNYGTLANDMHTEIRRESVTKSATYFDGCIDKMARWKGVLYSEFNKM